jgi:Concanavalin A-like lectin/glucanases superfamily/PEP-CTERM motif
MKKHSIISTTTALAAIAAFVGLQSASAQTLIHQWNFNETSGTSAANTVGGGPSANLMGGATFNGTGGATLNGTGGTYISLGGGLLTGLSSATFEGWFSYSVPNNNVHLFSFDDGTGTGTQNGGAWNGNYLRYNINNGTALAEIPNLGNPYNTGGSGDGKVAGPSILSQNTLHHVVFVYDPAAGVESLYLDGALEATVSGTVAPLSSIFQSRGSLGASPWDAWGDPYLTGVIDQFSIYDGALSGTQVAASFAAGPVTVPEPSSAVLGILGTALLGFHRRSRAS